MTDETIDSGEIFRDLEAGAEPLTLNAARKESLMKRNGRSLDLSVLYRFTTRGIRGVRLETFQHAGSRCTTKPAMLRFLKRLSGEPVNQPDAKLVSRAHQRARKMLAAAGLSGFV
jgi:hypothetical protein